MFKRKIKKMDKDEIKNLDPAVVLKDYSILGKQVRAQMERMEKFRNLGKSDEPAN